jgi:hypothetical protein
VTTKARRICIALLATLLPLLLRPATAAAGGLQVPPTAEQGLNLLYSSGQPERALEIFRQMQKSAPDHPLGYLLEADALWWQIYCEACEIKWNMIDAWDRPSHSDEAYLALTGKIIQLAEAKIAQNDSAEMELYDGMGWALQARVLGLHNSRRATAHAGVTARAHLLRCIAMDPQMVDAYAGLGLYNYYADALSAMAKVLRFFMGIPGGDRQEGIRQLRVAMDRGTLTRVEARFYLAKSLRNFDQDYANAADVMAPLTASYPQNPYFRLVLGDIHAKMGHKDIAAANFRAAQESPIANPQCAGHVRSLTMQALALLSTPRG